MVTLSVQDVLSLFENYKSSNSKKKKKMILSKAHLEFMNNSEFTLKYYKI
jgi:hypothetical protein